MRILGGIDKERQQLLRDPLGLAVAVLVPPLVVVLFAALDLGPITFSGPFRETDPAAMVVALAVWMSTLTVASHALMRDRREGLLTRLSTTPFPPGVLLISKFLVLGAVIVAQAALTCLAVVLLLPTQTSGVTFAALLPIVLLLALVALAVGLLLATVLRSAMQISQTVTLVTMGSLTVSGFLKPLADMGTLGTASSYLPFTAAYQAMIQLFDGTAVAGAMFALLAVEGVGALVVGWVLLQWSHRRLRGQAPRPTV